MSKFKPGDTAIDVLYGETAPQYVVIAEGGDAPTKKHPSRFLANGEAERLARANPGVAFHVAKIKRSIRVGAAMPAISEFDKQIAARADLAPGVWVRVSDKHHEHAGKVGYIDSLGEGSDTSVYVKLWRGGHVLRFSPTSLILAKATDREPDPYSSTAAPEYPDKSDFRVGDIVTRTFNGRDYEISGVIRKPSDNTVSFYRARDILSNMMIDLTPGIVNDQCTLKLSADERAKRKPQADEAKVPPFIDILTMLAVNALARRAKSIREREPQIGGAMSFDAGGPTIPVTTGDRVWVIVNEGFMGLTPGACVRGIVQAEPEGGHVLVSMEKASGVWSEPQLASVTRVYSVNDPAVETA